MVDKAGLLLLLWAGVTGSTVVDLHKRIIGGRDCHEDERLYHVRLIADTDYFCGGSLISKEWVLTAAHCLKEGTMFAEVGVHPGPGQKVNVLEKHTCCNNNEKHDLMLLKLDMSELGESFPKVDPVRKPQCDPGVSIRNGQQIQISIDPATVKMAGHAATAAGHNNEKVPGSSRTLQCADTDVVDCKDLVRALVHYDPKFYIGALHQHWRCYKSPGVDTCHGDSGGGVVFNGMIYGVHVLTGDEDYACKEAGAFMDLCHPVYAKWIRDTAHIDLPEVQ